jgi:hypothetical protein
LDRSVFHGGNAERPKDARFTGFWDQVVIPLIVNADSKPS